MYPHLCYLMLLSLKELSLVTISIMRSSFSNSLAIITPMTANRGSCKKCVQHVIVKVNNSHVIYR